MSTHGPEEPGRRIPGLLAIGGIIALGLGTAPAYFHYKAPRLKAELDARMSLEPTTPEGRLERWLQYGAPNIHHRLSVFGRFSPEQPWLVTHAVKNGAGLDLWGVDCTTLEQGSLTHIEGMTVVIELPAPRLLGHESLEPEQMGFVPVYEREEDVHGADARLEEIVWALLERMPQALEEDIEGASIRVRIGTTQAG